MVVRGLKIHTCRTALRMEGGVFFKELQTEGGRGSGGPASQTSTFPDLVPPPGWNSFLGYTCTHSRLTRTDKKQKLWTLLCICKINTHVCNLTKYKWTRQKSTQNIWYRWSKGRIMRKAHILMQAVLSHNLGIPLQKWGSIKCLISPNK